MPNEPPSPRPIGLSQKLRGLSRLRSKGIEDKGEAEQFRMVHAPDRPHRIITPVEAPSEEECGDTISSWHKAVKEDSDSEGEEEKVRPARSYWKTPDYTGGHPGRFQQSQHHEPHARGHSHIYTPSGLSQEVHVDSFQEGSRGARRSVSEHNDRTYLESPVPRPLVPNKSKERQRYLQQVTPPSVKEGVVERDISRGRGRGKAESPRVPAAATHSLPRECKIQTTEAVRRGQCPYCRCQLGNRTYLTCPNPPCGKGLTTFEGSWMAPPKLKDRRPASPSIFGVIGRQLLGRRPLKSSPDSPGSLPNQQKRSGTNTPEALATLPESIASNPPAAANRDIQTRSEDVLPSGSNLATKTLQPRTRQKTYPTPSPHPPIPPLRPPKSGLLLRLIRSINPQKPLPSSRPPTADNPPLRPAPPLPNPEISSLQAPASLNNPQQQQQPPTKPFLVSKFSTAHQPPQQYPPSHIASALSSSLPQSTAPSLVWITPSERSLFYPYYYSKPPSPPKKSSSRRRSQSQHSYPSQPPLQSRFGVQQQQCSTQSDGQGGYLDDIYDHYGGGDGGGEKGAYDTDVTTKGPEKVATKQKSWSSSKYSTGRRSEDTDDDDDDDDDDDGWNQLDDVETPTQLKPTPAFGVGGVTTEGKGRREGKGGYKSQAENKGLSVTTGEKEGSKERLAKELELRRMKWL
ncbi:hypothetical protein QC762_205800 [Podospora pseudocomata]|uniref:Uncharacterized protein n=1 Tax=Podospora pseudocomata TaxID=2093779 RepID=A0ABR0GLJ1_9PEZI|nr:hypothetical protein QC762_205800 [Podospora pseudocomata]